MDFHHYALLGLSPGATLDDVHKAYIEAVKRCHPDRFSGTDLYEQKQEELRQINNAYEVIKAEIIKRSNGTLFETARLDTDALFMERARKLFEKDLYDQALLMLSSAKGRGGAWYYLRGRIYIKKKKYNDAINDFELALKYEKNNQSYRRAWREAVELRKRKRRLIAAAVCAGAAAAAGIAAITSL